MVRRPSWTVILFVAGAVLLSALITVYLRAVREQVHGYYEAEFTPERLDEGPSASSATQTPPPSSRVADVPWIASDLELSHSLAFAMLAAQHGLEESRQKVDFLMGTTWGATDVPRQLALLPGQDPEVGFRHAAAALGLKRRYLVTSDGERFVRELKAQLSQGRAVRVAVDLTGLEERGREQPIAHSIVLVGYDETSFEYYQPVCRAPTPCEPGTRPPGAKGLLVPKERLLEASDRLAIMFKYPWSYQMLLLEKGAPPAPEALAEALERNGRALVGTKRGDLVSGAEAIDALAKSVSRSGREALFTRSLERSIRLAALVRRDDARILPLLFPGDPRVEPAVRQLERSAEAFGQAAATFEAKNNLFALNDALMAAAAADRSAGEALLLPRPDSGR